MSSDEELIGPINQEMAEVLLQAARALARMGWAVRIQNAALAEILKLACLEVAEEERKKSGRKVTIKWLRLTTGVSRPKVEQYMRQADSGEWLNQVVKEASERSPHARTLRTWLSDERFSDDGVARSLPRSAKHGSPNFYDLVFAADEAFGAATVLEDLTAADSVRTINDQVELLTTTFTRPADGRVQRRVAADMESALQKMRELSSYR